MYTWQIFREDEDSGEATYLGDIQADSQGLALALASQYFEIDMGELVARLVVRR